MTTDTLRQVITKNRAWYCLDCGKCSAVCPVTFWEKRSFASPRLLVEKAVLGQVDEARQNALLWSCLTCQRCSLLCPSDVNFSGFVRGLRSLARLEGCQGDCTHHETIQTWGRMMANPARQQNRLGWLTGDLKISARSDTVYFVGCLPYYDALFKNMGVEGVEIAQAAVKIMNRLGIVPNVLADERCCGHDQLWSGDVETFRALAACNLDQLKGAGAKRIVTTCPECARTLKTDYPQKVGEHGLEILHLTELLARSAPDLLKQVRQPPELGENDPVITYQDPCRLGRHLGIYAAPRQILSVMGFKLKEMERSYKASLCCGTSCWTACGQVSKNIQVDRLREARATGADLLVTACVKCQIHFKCAQIDPGLGKQTTIPIKDLTTLVAERLL